MANYAQLISAMEAVVKENGTGAITGLLLQNTLRAIIQELGAKCQFGGVATPETEPGTPDYNVAFIASGGTYPNFGGITVPDGNIAILSNTGENGSWESLTIQITIADKGITTAMLTDDAVTTDKIADDNVTRDKLSSSLRTELNNKADIDGFYSTMGVGAAENLIGRGSVIADYIFRTSGGTADIGSGLAHIKKLRGNTIVWNQLVSVPASDISETISGINLHDYRDGTYGVSSAAIYASAQFTIPNIPNIPIGHKVLIMGTPKQSNVQITFRVNGNIDTGNGLIFTNANATVTAIINAAIGSTVLTELRITPQIFDLTLMFGAGNEPTTVAEFRALFPYLFYPYNAGQLLSVTATGIKTNGFNQWDEQWELGFIDSAGQNAPASTTFRSKNYIPIIGGLNYYVKQDYGNIYIFQYDANKNYIRNSDRSGSGLISIGSDARYIRFYFEPNGTKTLSYQNDICINISWSGYRNGEYEPYWESELPIPITTMTGKLNGAGESVVIFPDGLKSAGTAFDEITSDKAIKRIGKVDLGTLDWTYNDGVFIASLPNSKLGSYSVAGNAICAKYINVAWSDMVDKTLSLFFAFQKGVNIKDTAYSDTATFKTAMSGIYLYYEFENPEEYVLDAELSMSYRVDDFGTEMELPQNDDEPVTAPIRYEVQYAMNAVDTLRRLPENYISKESFIDFLAEFDSKIGAAIGATIVTTMAFDSESQKYNFDISVTPNNP